MLKSQTLALRASEIKVRLVEIAGAEGELGDEVKTELTELRNEAKDVELRWQAATTAEGVTETVESPTEGIPEQREVVELRSKSSVSSYVNAAVEMRSVEGPEAEYNAALGMGMDRFPLALLAPEKRQTTDVDVSTKQNTWLDRLFDGTAAQRLGVTFLQRRSGRRSLSCHHGRCNGRATGQVGSCHRRSVDYLRNRDAAKAKRRPCGLLD